MNLQVQIIPNKFVKEDGETKKVKTAQTALVTFFDDNGKMQNIVEYGYKDLEEILIEINAHGYLNLSYCYVKDIGKISTEYPFIEGIHAKNALFDGDISFCGKTISGKANFKDATFNSFVDFTGTKFIDKSDFSGAEFNHVVTFEKAKFREDIEFSGTTFKGMAAFYECEFIKKSIFTFARFCSGTEFSGSRFRIGVDFSDVKVYDSSNFVSVTFDGKVLVTRALFTGVVLFSNVFFNDALVISDSTFDKKTDFDKCTFNIFALIDNVVFRDSSSFSLTRANYAFKLLSIKFLSYTNLQFLKCEHLSLCDCVFEKTCTISNRSSYQSVVIHGCTTSASFSIPYNDNLKEAIYEGKNSVDIATKILQPQNYEAPIMKGVRLASDQIKYKIREANITAAQSFNFLKINYNRNGEYENEDQAYVEYRRCMRKSRKLSFSRGFDFLIDKISCYCTNPLRVLIVAFAAILAFAGIFHFSSSFSFIPDTITFGKNYQGLLGCIYHSVITFFTIGYGDSQPIGKLGLFITGLEGFIGVFLMSLFTVSFVRKVLRQIAQLLQSALGK